MKKLLLMFATVGVIFTACNKNTDCGHDYIEVDYSKKLVGTWTTIDAENEFAEALIFNADGSVTSTGVFEGGHWEKKGTFKIQDNKITLSYEDGDFMESRFEMVEGKIFSMVDDELDVHFNYNYCENDLSDEILGMWVCNDGPSDKENDMVIQTFNEGGTVTKTGWSVASNEFIVKEALTYKVVGDLLFHQRPSDMVTEGVAANFASKLTYMPNANQLGDMLTNTAIKLVNGQAIVLSMSMLRIKQSLDLEGQVYAYKSAYVSNVEGKDEDFTVFDSTFNIAKIEAYDFDKLFGADLHIVELLNNSIKHTFRPNGQNVVLETPITVDGNKVTLDYSNVNPACRKVEMYMFQDKNNTQLHMYMPTSSFVNYFANMEFSTLLTEGKIDPTDATAIEKVYTDMEARIESINVSFVFKARE